MYKILIKHNPSANKSNTTLWKAHGTMSTSTTVTAFKEFETDDLEVLSAEVVALDKIYGFENIKVIKEIDVTYGVEIVDDEDEGTDATAPSEPDDSTGDETVTP